MPIMTQFSVFRKYFCLLSSRPRRNNLFDYLLYNIIGNSIKNNLHFFHFYKHLYLKQKIIFLIFCYF